MAGVLKDIDAREIILVVMNNAVLMKPRANDKKKKNKLDYGTHLMELVKFNSNQLRIEMRFSNCLNQRDQMVINCTNL
jgi:hypothetical protein